MIGCKTDTQPVHTREEFGNHTSEEAENPAVADPDPANPDAAPENPAQKRRRKGGGRLRLVQARAREGLSTRRPLWT